MYFPTMQMYLLDLCSVQQRVSTHLTYLVDGDVVSRQSEADRSGGSGFILRERRQQAQCPGAGDTVGFRNAHDMGSFNLSNVPCRRRCYQLVRWGRERRRQWLRPAQAAPAGAAPRRRRTRPPAARRPAPPRPRAPRAREARPLVWPSGSGTRTICGRSTATQCTINHPPDTVW